MELEMEGRVLPKKQQKKLGQKHDALVNIKQNLGNSRSRLSENTIGTIADVLEKSAKLLMKKRS